MKSGATEGFHTNFTVISTCERAKNVKFHEPCARGTPKQDANTQKQNATSNSVYLTVELSSTTPLSTGTNSLSLPYTKAVQLTSVLTPTRGPVTPRPQFLAGVPRILLVTVPTTTSRRAPPPLPPPPPPRAGAVARTSAVTSRLPRLRTVALHSSTSPRLLRLGLGLGLRLSFGRGVGFRVTRL